MTLLLRKLLAGRRDPDAAKLLHLFKQFDTAVKGYIRKNANAAL